MIHEHRNTRMRNRNLYVLTGGPGGGKSTVLDILDGMGYHTVREAGRKIILACFSFTHIDFLQKNE